MLGMLVGVAAWPLPWTHGLLATILVLFTLGVGAVCLIPAPRSVIRRASWANLVLLLMMCRIGEATNPGPAHAHSSFALGAFNPSGLNGKAPYIVSHLTHGDIWAVSETHLCTRSLQMFRTGLHFAESPYKYCVGGHPVPSQSNRMFHSAWRGVAVLSKFPTRPLPVQWPDGIYESSRIQITATLVHDSWLTGATIYGEPESSTYPFQKQNNEQLLQCAVNHVCHLSRGPRFVAGDWNVSANSLPAFEALEAAGFRELQDIALQQWGQQIVHTCKASTRKDYCYISRELQGLLQSVHVENDIFADHAVIWGVFNSMTQVLPRQVWTTPKQLPWPGSWNVNPTFWASESGSCDHRYAALWGTHRVQCL